MLTTDINACRRAGKYVGICGQGHTDHPDLAEWLVEQGIESMSLNPDTVVETWLRLAHRDSVEATVWPFGSRVLRSLSNSWRGHCPRVRRTVLSGVRDDFRAGLNLDEYLDDFDSEPRLSRPSN